MAQLTQSRLKELLSYDKDTGKFIWVKRSSAWATNIVIGAEAGSLHSTGYRIIWIDGVAHRACRLVFLYVDNRQVDKTIVFLNGDRADNRYNNLDVLYDFSSFVLNQKSLLQVLEYIPETGDFIRLTSFGVSAIRGSKAGGLTKANYSIIALGKNRYYAHRLAFLYMLGEMPPEDVDHIDGNPLDNSWKNLRLASKSDNLCNQKLRIDNNSGVKNVIYLKDCEKYTVTVTKFGKRNYIGRFDTLEEATLAATEARNTIHEEFARHS